MADAPPGADQHTSDPLLLEYARRLGVMNQQATEQDRFAFANSQSSQPQYEPINPMEHALTPHLANAWTIQMNEGMPMPSVEQSSDAGVQAGIAAAFAAQVAQQMLALQAARTRRVPAGPGVKGDGLCKFWRETGNCLKGAACDFIHGKGCRFWLLSGSCHKGDDCDFEHKASEKSALKVKRTICQFWQQGSCAKGDSCGYAHGNDELGVPMPEHGQTPLQGKYKICRFWEGGHCAKGAACSFAHGYGELGAPLAEDADPFSKRDRERGDGASTSKRPRR